MAGKIDRTWIVETAVDGDVRALDLSRSEWARNSDAVASGTRWYYGRRVDGEKLGFDGCNAD